jgi:hypothetical protein
VVFPLAKHWLLYGYFVSIVLDRNARDGKSTKTQGFKNSDAVKTIDLLVENPLLRL